MPVETTGRGRAVSQSEGELNAQNLPYIEELYADFLNDPSSVPLEWRDYFAALAPSGTQRSIRLPEPSFRSPGLFQRPVTAADTFEPDFQERVFKLVRNYRVRGHRAAQVDPLGLQSFDPPELQLSYYGFTEEDLSREIRCDSLQNDTARTLGQIIEVLHDTYCRSIGVQYMHIDNFEIRRWLQRRMESTRNRLHLNRDEQIRIYTRLTDAVTFEEFVRKKFVGAKSFSLEGCESLIPLLDLAIEKAADQGFREIVFGMAHRGRLNVLANIIGKTPREIFREFSDAPGVHHRDVKYHLGYSNEWETSSGKGVHLSLCFNPSHLEFVSPVALGRVRAKQDRNGDTLGERCLGLIIHGDASFAGEGVVQETFNLSQLEGYTVHGAIHVVVNNQIGFTTSPTEARSSAYPTDVARMLQIPIFHVNGEDPEAVAQVVRLALDFRETFRRDAVIDMFGYRRLGHNESDEPAFTHPVLYRAISRREPVRESYLKHLLALGEVTREEAEQITKRRHDALEKEFSASQEAVYRPPVKKIRGVWKLNSYFGGAESAADHVETAYPREKLQALLGKLTEVPADFHPNPKIKKFLEARHKMAVGDLSLDWAAGETLAFATICSEGTPIRVSGQDVGRGTFSQRHAILYDYENGKPYIPLNSVAAQRAAPTGAVGGRTSLVSLINSPLSEAGVLGFDYGYSLDYPDALVCWEAQFGDFANAAQVIIDQFITSAETKWDRLSGIVLLLPHGLEGQGPEHSSARLERFLDLAADDNIQIVYPTTPAQYFHCLRRQVLRRWRKPLVVMTPKSLLRNPEALSPLEDFSAGQFEPIIGDASAKPDQARRVLLCSGKVYYDLLKRRQDSNSLDTAIIRLEQLYPLSDIALKTAFDAYADETPVVWVQEEPENMGAWRYLRSRFGEKIGESHPFSGAYRPASASPAAGSERVHKQELRELLNAAFAP